MAVVYNRAGILALKSIQKKAVERRLRMSVIDVRADVRECRFCLSGPVDPEEDNPMISPCQCTGTQQYIHRDCLLRWTNSFPTNDRRNTHCGVCQTEYTVPVGGRPVLVSIHSSLIRQGNRKYTVLFIVYVAMVMSNLQVIMWFIVNCIQSKIDDSDWEYGGMTISVVNGIVTMFAPLRSATRRLDYVPHALEFLSGVTIIMGCVIAFLLNAGIAATASLVFISFTITTFTFITALRRIRNVR